MTNIEKLQAICEAEQNGETARAARIEIEMLEENGIEGKEITFGNYAGATIYKNKAGRYLVTWYGHAGGFFTAAGKFKTLEAAAETARGSYASEYTAKGIAKKIAAA